MKKLLLITLSILMLALFVSCTAEQVDAHTCDSAVNEAVAPLNEEIAKLSEELNGVKASNATLGSDKSTLEAKIGEHEAAISAKEKELAELDATAKTLGEDKQTLSDSISALEAEIAGLKKCLTDIHEFENNVCKYCGWKDEIDATQMTANELNAAVTAELEAGITNINVALAPDAHVEMFTAIRRAIRDTEGVADGSINLTLKGVTAIPDHSTNSQVFGEFHQDENGEYLDEPDEVLELYSINLPDVLSIGIMAFAHCENLVSLTAPKVQMIDEWAFAYTGLTSVDLPEATTIENVVFYSCSDITELHLPKVTALEDQALDMCEPKNEVTIYLTSADEIVVDKDCFYILEYYENLATKVNLVLHANKQSEVNGNTWTAKDAEGNEVSFTFKSIEFLCVDGTTNHTYGAAVNSGDATHTSTCTTCNLTKIERCYGEATCKELASCEVCGVKFGELSDHVIDPATGYCKFGCGEFVSVAKVTLGETTTYYETLKDVRYNKQNGATITLFKDITDNTYMEWAGCSFTLDLNGFNLNRGGYELYVSGNERVEVSLLNTAEARVGINSVSVRRFGKLTIGKNVDVVTILSSAPTDISIDLSEADFTSTTIKIDADGFNTSQITLGSYAVYDANGNVVTGELTKGVTYTIKAAS